MKQNTLTPTTRFLLWLIIPMLLLIGCGSLEVEEALIYVKVNPDLSGKAGISLMMTPYQFSRVTQYYGDYSNPGSRLAQTTAEEFGWDNYFWDYSTISNGTELVIVGQSFRNENHLANMIAGSSIQNEKMLARQDNLFNTIYLLQFLQNNPDVTFPINVKYTLPGTIIETNGSDRDGDGEVFWSQPQQSTAQYAVSAMLPEYDVAFDVDLEDPVRTSLVAAVTADTADLMSMASIYDDGDIDEVLAAVWAENLGLTTYTVESAGAGNSRTTIKITSTYPDRDSLITQLNDVPLFTGMTITENSSGFNSELTLSGNLMPLDEVFGEPDTLSLMLHMPGDIVNSDGNTEQLAWSDDTQSIQVTSIVFGSMWDSPVVIAMLAGGVLLLIILGGVFVMRRRKKESNYKQIGELKNE